MDSNNNNIGFDVPDDIILCIFNYIGRTDFIFNLALCNKRLYSIYYHIMKKNIKNFMNTISNYENRYSTVYLNQNKYYINIPRRKGVSKINLQIKKINTIGIVKISVLCKPNNHGGSITKDSEYFDINFINFRETLKDYIERHRESNKKK